MSTASGPSLTSARTVIFQWSWFSAVRSATKKTRKVSGSYLLDGQENNAIVAENGRFG